MADTVKTEVLAQVETEKYENGACFAFRKIRQTYESGRIETGFTFVWLKEDGTITPRRGQVLIPNEKVIAELLLKAMAAGWFAG